MCILIHQPADYCFKSEQLQDFYNKNSDGFGAVVKTPDGVKVIKAVGKYQEIEDLYYEQVACHESIIHFRMKTHGDIDMENCHPYEVLEGLWMAHNGVLHTGNMADQKMSDTWHYIRDYLRPILQTNPDLLKNEVFQKLVGHHIGASNKFGFMDDKGEIAIINRSSGVEHDGVWYSNTYAWTPWKFGYGKPPQPYYPPVKPKQYNHSAFASSPTWKEWDKYDRMERQGSLPFPARASTQVSTKKSKGKKPKRQKISTSALSKIIRSSYNALNMDDYDGLARWVSNHPLKAQHLIYELLGSERDPIFNSEVISDRVNNDVDWAAETIMDLWIDMEDIMCQLAGIKQTKEEVNVPAQT